MKKFLTNIEEIITGAALCVMTVLIVMNVFCRLFLKKSFTWSEEISYICYAYVIFVGSSSLYKRFGHSAIDLVVRAFPQKVQVICAIFSTGVLTVTCALSFVLSWILCKQLDQKNTASENTVFSRIFCISTGIWIYADTFYYVLQKCYY